MRARPYVLYRSRGHYTWGDRFFIIKDNTTPLKQLVTLGHFISCHESYDSALEAAAGIMRTELDKLKLSNMENYRDMKRTKKVTDV